MIRAYVTTRIGTGTKQDPIRSKANNYISVALGGRFWEYDNPVRLYSFIICNAPQANHDDILADADIEPISELYVNVAEMQTGLDKTVADFPPALYIAMRDRLELIGVNTNWITVATQIRQIYSYMLRTFTFVQWAYGKHDGELIQFMDENIVDMLGRVCYNSTHYNKRLFTKLKSKIQSRESLE